jgi:NAD(P)H-dependent flavin oxidoreductase YrpB (nitropropane dioxygenase family)
VRAALAAGAVAAVVGTRFLLSDESRAHPDYKNRCLEAETTLLTELFGLGWPDAPHRVVANAATDHWLGDDPRGPAWIRAANRVTTPAVRRLPAGLQARALKAQRPTHPFLRPEPATDDGPDNLLDSGPLYAGANVGLISEVRPAAQLVAALTP